MGEAARPTPLEQAEVFRLEAARKLDPRRRSELGQFLTPANLARLMAGFFGTFGDHMKVLEAGAGVGSLLAATVAEACERPRRPQTIRATAFEIEPLLARYLERTLVGCKAAAGARGMGFHAHVACRDFIAATGRARFTHAILNPPYGKLGRDSRLRLRDAGIETSNLYAAFVARAIQLLEPGGELVAITPRSFCNGRYFRPFREYLLRRTALVRVHLFESRTLPFAGDGVLQENVIFHLVKGRPQGDVILSSSLDAEIGGHAPSLRTVPFDEVVRPGDKERFLRLASDDRCRKTSDTFARLPSKLGDLGLSVSTGKVVDFRAREFLRSDASPGTRPLVYPTHFAGGVVRWPKAGKKPNALVDAPGTSKLWMPRGTYVLVKRFSSKEERRRVVAAVFDPRLVPGEKVGFENHLNVLHEDGAGLAVGVARGLAAFLNSTLVDAYFRQWSGNTQVNATDLRSLRYPSRASLEELGKRVGRSGSQDAVDRAVSRMLTPRRPQRPDRSATTEGRRGAAGRGRPAPG